MLKAAFDKPLSDSMNGGDAGVECLDDEGIVMLGESKDLSTLEGSSRVGTGVEHDGNGTAFFAGEFYDVLGRHGTSRMVWSPSLPRGNVAAFTDKQGQYLSFIYLYTKLNRRPPATADIAWYFQVTAPSAHNMVKQLCKKGLLEKTPRAPRSLRVLVPKDELPELL